MVRPGWLVAVALAVLASLAWTGGLVAAQPSKAEGAEQSRVETDPETGEHYRVVRPSAPLRRGVVRTPRWGVVAVGALVLAASASYLVLRLRRWRR